jgi:hypothetical protein
MTKETDISPERRQAWKAHKARLKARLDADLERHRSPPFVFTRDRIAVADPARSKHAKVPSSSTDMAPDIEPPPHPLFVYEPGDLNDFSVEDVHQVWEHRRDLCGTVEAAAEAFAILRVATGADENYRGWQAYMQHANVVALADELPRLPGEARPEPTPDIPAQTSSSDLATPSSGDLDGPGLDRWLVDGRSIALRNIRLRKGQSRFRDEVLAYHGGKCCVSGCADEVLLEAAHIAPYKGDHSHDVQNGLALRVDLHRLFDRFLLSIDDREMVVCVSPLVADALYRSLHGRRVFRTFNAPHRELLQAHFAQFQAALPRDAITASFNANRPANA